MTVAAMTMTRRQRAVRDARVYRDVWRKYRAFTMVPPKEYVANLRIAAGARRVEGCVVECGVWRGGMSAGMAEVLGSGREYFLFDSFEGLPPAREVDGAAAMAWQADTAGPMYHDNCAAPMETAERAMRMSGAERFRLVKGWFDKTLPGFELPGPIAVLRLDGDWYESTMCCLRSLVPRLAKGGVIIVDDYRVWDGCSRAVHEYLAETGSVMRIGQVYGVTVVR